MTDPNIITLPGLRLAIEPPRISAGLRYRLSQVDVHGAGPVAEFVPPGEVEEAAALLLRFKALCPPAPPEVIRAWLDLVAAAVANTPSDATLMMRARCVQETSGDLPLVCWTRETRAAFARRDSRTAHLWPADTEVDAFLRPIGLEVLRKTRALEALVEAAGKRASMCAVDSQDLALTPAERKAAIEAIYARHARGKAPDEAPAGTVAAFRDVRVTGEALWNSRNATRSQMGLPPLPRPASFEGYGVVR